MNLKSHMEDIKFSPGANEGFSSSVCGVLRWLLIASNEISRKTMASEVERSRTLGRAALEKSVI